MDPKISAMVFLGLQIMQRVVASLLTLRSAEGRSLTSVEKESAKRNLESAKKDFDKWFAEITAPDEPKVETPLPGKPSALRPSTSSPLASKGE